MMLGWLGPLWSKHRQDYRPESKKMRKLAAITYLLYTTYSLKIKTSKQPGHFFLNNED